MTRFLVYEQLPPALARWLGAGDHHQGRGFPSSESRLVDGPVIIWIRLGNTRRAALLGWFEAGPQQPCPAAM